MAGSPKQKRPASRDLFLGVDGGGTKTHAALFNSKGALLSEQQTGPSNPLRIGVRKALVNIQAAAVGALDEIDRTPEDVVGVVAGLAGARREDYKMQMRTGIGHFLPNASVDVVTDADIALFATTSGCPGVVVISGTGSVCYGSGSDGRTAVAGGWGPIAGDEGGGVSIAREALQAVARASDGRGRRTELSDLAARYFRAPSAEDLIVAIYSPSTDYKRLAGFARLVVEAARDGDRVAKTILDNAGTELGIAACAVLTDLKLEKEKVPVGLVGGIFAAGDLIKDPLLQRIRKCAPEAYLKIPKISPAGAAAKMAIARHHQSPSR